MTGSSATVYEFDIPSERPPDTPTIGFTIRHEYGVDAFTLRMPKMSIGLGMINLLESEDNLTAFDFGLQLARLLWQFVDYVVSEDPEPTYLPPEDPDDPDAERVENPLGGQRRGRSRLVERLNNPNDALDILNLEPVFRRCVNAMFDRPTGPLPESTAPPVSTGLDSAEASSGQRGEMSGASAPPPSSPPPRTSRANSSKSASGTATKPRRGNTKNGGKAPAAKKTQRSRAST